MAKSNIAVTRPVQATRPSQPMKRIPDQRISPDNFPDRLPDIHLHHGETMWLLTQLGFRGTATEQTFHEYIKSLRKLGIPFEERIGLTRRGLANYSYYHLMELVLALTLRVYHMVPDSVLVGIIRYRRQLYRQYRRAYAERYTGAGEPIELQTNGHVPIGMRGTYLDLQLNFSGGKLVRFGPPKLLSPYEALSIFAARDVAARAFLPIGLSLLSERVVALALGAPLIRRGRRSNKADKEVVKAKPPRASPLRRHRSL